MTAIKARTPHVTFLVRNHGPLFGSKGNCFTLPSLPVRLQEIGFEYQHQIHHQDLCQEGQNLGKMGKTPQVMAIECHWNMGKMMNCFFFWVPSCSKAKYPSRCRSTWLMVSGRNFDLVQIMSSIYVSYFVGFHCPF